jgi:MFS transporter, SHS family, lactate transporter
VQGWAFMAFVNFMLWAIFSLYPTFLITVRHLDPNGVFPYVAIYSTASIFGKPLAGYLVEKFGERRTLVSYLLLTIPSTLLYTLIDDQVALAIGAVLMGLVANSVFGIVPMYLARRFTAARRGVGVGIGYAMTSLSVGAPYVVAIFTPVWGLPTSMAVFIASAALISALIAAFNTENLDPEANQRRADMTAFAAARPRWNRSRHHHVYRSVPLPA